MLRSAWALIATAALLGAAEIHWYPDYATTEQHAQQEQKKIFVFISTEDCTWCKKLEATTFRDDAIVKRLEADYRSVHVTRDKDVYPAELKAVVVPMCYFLTAEGKVIDYTRGYWGSDDFNLILDDVEKRQHKMKE